MPKSSKQQSLHCQQAGDFTVVTTTTSASEANKENLAQSRCNYQTLSQAIALERLQLLRVVELENSIFTLAFHLIESFYRPPSLGASEPPKSASVQTKRKRRSKSEPKTVTDMTSGECHHALGVFPMPRKRIHGLSKAYKAEYGAKMDQPGISKHFGTFHHDLLDWQLIFAPATDFPTTGINLAKELNFDSLFDYEDAIATTANLLAIARQHSELIGSVVSKSILTEYIPDQSKGASDEFCKLTALAEQLIEHKKNRVAQLIQTENCENDNSGHLLTNWFKCDKPAPNSKQHMECFAPTQQQNTKDILREISAWEEFVDVVEISTK